MTSCLWPNRLSGWSLDDVSGSFFIPPRRLRARGGFLLNQNGDSEGGGVAGNQSLLFPHGRFKRQEIDALLVVKDGGGPNGLADFDRHRQGAPAAREMAKFGPNLGCCPLIHREEVPSPALAPIEPHLRLKLHFITLHPAILPPHPNCKNQCLKNLKTFSHSQEYWNVFGYPSSFNHQATMPNFPDFHVIC